MVACLRRIVHVYRSDQLLAVPLPAKGSFPPNSAGARGNYERQVCGVKSGSREG